MKAWTTLAVAMLAVACGGPAVTSTQIHGPDGRDDWVAIVCNGAQMECYQRAGEVCPAGYEVRDTAGHEGQDSHGFADRTSAVYSSHHTYAGEMLIKCHGAPVAPLGRECMGDGSCDTGQRCAFAVDGGTFDVGHCASPPTR